MDAGRLDSILPSVRKPGQYTGGEWNAAPAPRDAALRVALGFPDAYEIGMSCLGYLIVHGLVASLPGCGVERFFSPLPDMEAALRREGLPLFTLESRTPVRDFDVVAFSLQYEILATNVLNALDLAGLPVRAARRGPSHPLVVGGGPVAMAPEPLAPFLDVFLPGDAEATLPAFLARLIELKAEGAERPSLLRDLARLPGVYVPSLYRPRYGAGGAYQGIEPLEPGLPGRVRAGVVQDLETAFSPDRPPVPNVEAVHERVVLEIMRGCPNFCRFCQAGFTRRPPRLRSVEALLDQARRTYENTGFSDISLASLSSVDYPCLDELMARLEARFEGLAVGVSLPSLRVDDVTADLPARLKAVRKSGLTLAPETGREGLRRAMNKRVRNETLERVARSAWEQGWRVLKLYFMMGLPGETAEDRAAIVDLSHQMSGLRRATGKGPGKVNVTVSNFVPRPHTPMQWCGMVDPASLKDFQGELLDRVRMRSVRLKFHEPLRNLVETVLARGDRRMADAVEAAWRAGARFDAWDDHFDGDRWLAAFREAGLDPAAWAGPREPEEVFPWDVVDTGVSRAFLRAEYERGLAGELTDPCEPGQCAGCGLSAEECTLKSGARGTGHGAREGR